MSTKFPPTSNYYHRKSNRQSNRYMPHGHNRIRNMYPQPRSNPPTRPIRPSMILSNAPIRPMHANDIAYRYLAPYESPYEAAYEPPQFAASSELNRIRPVPVPVPVPESSVNADRMERLELLLNDMRHKLVSDQSKQEQNDNMNKQQQLPPADPVIVKQKEYIDELESKLRKFQNQTMPRESENNQMNNEMNDLILWGVISAQSCQKQAVNTILKNFQHKEYSKAHILTAYEHWERQGLLTEYSQDVYRLTRKLKRNTLEESNKDIKRVFRHIGAFRFTETRLRSKPQTKKRKRKGKKHRNKRSVTPTTSESESSSDSYSSTDSDTSSYHPKKKSKIQSPEHNEQLKMQQREIARLRNQNAALHIHNDQLKAKAIVTSGASQTILTTNPNTINNQRVSASPSSESQSNKKAIIPPPTSTISSKKSSNHNPPKLHLPPLKGPIQQQGTK